MHSVIVTMAPADRGSKVRSKHGNERSRYGRVPSSFGGLDRKMVLELCNR